jgi:hypothetical protein
MVVRETPRATKKWLRMGIVRARGFQSRCGSVRQAAARGPFCHAENATVYLNDGETRITQKRMLIQSITELPSRVCKVFSPAAQYL